ncbi:MAG: flagellar biosynthesis protein FlhB [Desulfurispora sp.]|uniref:flagellar biosynthesis protein FlhB n=1 Tax=Desulfurispora sp. TaxID=3014275 RepID=UPI00404A6782
MSGAQQKTEQPTPRRLQEARRRGQVARSKDLSAALILLAGVLAVYLLSPLALDKISRHMAWYFSSCLNWQLPDSSRPYVIIRYILDEGLLWLPLFLVLVLAALAANVAQFGFLSAPGVLVPKLERLHPLEGMKKIFSLRSLLELVKSILKIVLVGLVTWQVALHFVPGLLNLYFRPAAGELRALLDVLIAVGAAGGAAFLLLGAADYFYQRYDYFKSLRMTKQEVRDEYKQTEGDPLVKGWLKRRQREIAMNRIRSEVPRATVVVTNPVHYAVALRYRDGVDRAPVVVAKGAGDLAVQVKQIAARHRVPVIEDPPLARQLYRQVEVGREIPVELYRAVAEVLALVYRLKRRN